MQVTIPECFCWTRFGTEAGQSIQRILERKEMERIANRGLFFWGIGNALRPSMIELLHQTDSPEVIFSPIRGIGRPEDAGPASVVAWTEAAGLNGEPYELPQGCLITSRFDAESPRSRHYALVCHRESPIELSSGPEHIEFAQLRNLLSGRQVGASQVSAVVRVDPTVDVESSNSYRVSLRANLVFPYLIVLHAPVHVPAQEEENWEMSVSKLWEQTWRRAADRDLPGLRAGLPAMK